MSNPRYVDVLGAIFEVVVTDELDEENADFSGTRKRIRLSESSDTKDEDTFHEMCHAVLHRAGLSSQLAAFPGDMEEAICRALEHGLFPIYGKNWKRVTRKEKKQ